MNELKVLFNDVKHEVKSFFKLLDIFNEVSMYTKGISSLEMLTSVLIGTEESIFIDGKNFTWTTNTKNIKVSYGNLRVVCSFFVAKVAAKLELFKHKI